MRQYDNTNDLIKWIVIACDFLLLNAVLLGALFLNKTFLHLSPLVHTRMIVCLANLSLAICEMKWSPIVHKRTVPSHKVVARVCKLVTAQAVLCYALLRVADPWTPFLNSVVLVNIVYLVLMLLSRMMEWTVLKNYRRMGRNTRRVLLVGNDISLAPVCQELLGDATTGYRVMGYYADEPINFYVDQTETSFFSRKKVSHIELKHLGTLEDFDNLMESGKKLKADDLYCSLRADGTNRLKRIIKYSDQSVTRFFYVPQSLINIGVPLKMERLGDLTIFTNYEEPLSILSNRVVKRTFDIVFSSIILICLLPFIPIVWLIIRKQSPGPLFFKQERTGINGKNFYCYKFRSMHVNKDADLVQATENDPRKFAFGNFMRKTNIDELPQFFNVFKGDMSIVGPRPHMLHHTEVYSQLIDKYMVRHFAKPGITGWAQVTGYRGETKELWQMEERVKRDIWYIENWSIWLDLRIIWRTIKQMLGGGDEHAY